MSNRKHFTTEDLEALLAHTDDDLKKADEAVHSAANLDEAIDKRADLKRRAALIQSHLDAAKEPPKKRTAMSSGKKANSGKKKAEKTEKPKPGEPAQSDQTTPPSAQSPTDIA